VTVIINVQISLDVALSLCLRLSVNNEHNEICDLESEFGVTLKPLHENTSDPILIRHFIMEVDNMITAKKLINHLLKIKYVEGAYIKTADELP
jgi:hypothetical protein